MHPKDADGLANSADPDQRSSLIWVCTVSPGPICLKTFDPYGTFVCMLGFLFIFFEAFGHSQVVSFQGFNLAIWCLGSVKSG